MLKKLMTYTAAGILGLSLMSGAQAGSNSVTSSNDIVDVAVAVGSFDTLVTAVKAAGLVNTLKGEGPFTVFAPTDEAFAKLLDGTLEALLADKQALAEVLTYHIVAGKVMAADVVSLSSAKSVQGQSIRISTGAGVKVDDANVTQTDIEASNGVIHVIDAVMLPNHIGAAKCAGRTIAWIELPRAEWSQGR